MRFLHFVLFVAFALWQGSVGLIGAEYRMSNGDIVRGEAVSFDDYGLVIRMSIGGYTPRISWSRLTQESLQELAKNPEAATFAEPFIDIPPTPKEKKQKREITLMPVPRVERIEKPKFLSSLTTPAGIAIFLALFMANLYAAYEIARFRHRPPALVCGVSAVLPVAGPILFLSMPPGETVEAEQEIATGGQAPAAAPGASSTGPMAKVPMASGLSIAQGEKAGPAGASQAGQTFKRGEYTFNRRFFESKFPGFFRVVQGDADKDLVLVIRVGKAEHIAKRISRIASNEMHVQLVRGGETSVVFAEIGEVIVQHKDAAA